MEIHRRTDPQLHVSKMISISHAKEHGFDSKVKYGQNQSHNFTQLNLALSSYSPYTLFSAFR